MTCKKRGIKRSFCPFILDDTFFRACLQFELLKLKTHSVLLQLQSHHIQQKELHNFTTDLGPFSRKKYIDTPLFLVL